MVAADHLRVERQHGLFHHHGIDLGDRKVAHYLEGKVIIISSIKDFTLGKKIIVVDHPQPSLTNITIKRAMSRVGEQSYNLLFNNCEHFANWCITGIHRSQQIEKLLKITKLNIIGLNQVLPKQLISELAKILSQNIQVNKASNTIKQSMTQIYLLKNKLNDQLQSILESLSNPQYNSYGESHPNQKNEILTYQAQFIADILSSLEKLEDRINLSLKD